ncbi:biotin--[acetyl-CoA-carboxylase] ligase [Edaphobacter flagellatus]|uniref:biotin--[acetyl-CoA-carboxylase] ligase n=1 Tax=Edaphobacter flagellatus TaxID=1933044 RepID=UPI0021B4D428|nr:biotin--[acetyl-CoA-carboxylase] ligase [Edaphobacter flagellatus]
MAFDLEAIVRGLTDTRFGTRIRHFDSVGSTNTLALEAAQAGADEGVWIADEQTAGRGRGNHNWHSAAGSGLYVSALVKPPIPARDALPISLATGLAAKSAIAEVTGLEIDIRWPNDLLIGSKKCGGILVETAIAPEQAGRPAMLRYAVIGVGINLNHAAFPPELASQATSLRIETGNKVSREELLVALLRQIEDEMALLVRGWQGTDNGPGLYARFAEASTWVRGKHVRVDEAGGYTGVTDGLNARGFLEVNCDDGQRRTVLSGGVREI